MRMARARRGGGRPTIAMRGIGRAAGGPGRSRCAMRCATGGIPRPSKTRFLAVSRDCFDPAREPSLTVTTRDDEQDRSVTAHNRPYIFPMAAALRVPGRDDEYYARVRDSAENNGIAADQLDRAAFVDGVRRGGTDMDEWIRQEFIVDGWLHGYVSLDASPTDPEWSTWTLAQRNDEHYGRPQIPPAGKL